MTPAEDLYRTLKDIPLVLSEGDGCLIVYVERKKLGVLRAIPARFEGLPVRVEAVGRVRPGGAR